jgi:hypothetical protein
VTRQLLGSPLPRYGHSFGVVTVAILFFPPKISNRNQPFEIGIMAAIKVGCTDCFVSGHCWRSFDEVDGHEKAAQLRKSLT